MALSSDLITTARQVDRRRSISTSYYALVHGLAEPAAWSRLYRDLNHLTAKNACSRPELQGCSQELARFLMAFPTLQELRHQADYDPNVRFKQGEALSADDDAERALLLLSSRP